MCRADLLLVWRWYRNYAIIEADRDRGENVLTILIADDERGIVELIKHLIDPQQVETEIVAEAYNGQSAYEQILEKRPDVAITDIRMPGMSGIDLIRRCAEECPETTFVIISGFQEFSYAQAALQYGAADYLLKPLKRTALNETLLRIEREKGAKESQRAQVLERSRTLETNTRLLRRQALAELTQELPDGSKGTQLFVQDTVFDQRPGQYCIGIVRLIDTLHVNEAVSTDTADVLMEKIVRCLGSVTLDVEYAYEDDAGILYLHYGERSVGDLMEILSREIYNANYAYELLDITIACGREIADPRLLGESYRTAVSALHTRMDTGTGAIICYQDSMRESRRPLTAQEQQRIRSMLGRMDPRSATEVIRELFATWRMNEQLGTEMYRLATDLIGEIHREMEADFPECDIPDRSASLKAVRNALFSETLEDICIQYAHRAIEACRMRRDNAISKPVREMCKYMQTHLHEQITLKDLAKLVTLSQVYICNIFKKEMGVSISAYCTNLRMDKAKELLKNTSMSVSAIAEAVGYQDARYFSKQFIRTVGIKPMDYRKFYA